MPQKNSFSVSPHFYEWEAGSKLENPIKLSHTTYSYLYFSDGNTYLQTAINLVAKQPCKTIIHFGEKNLKIPFSALSKRVLELTLKID